MASSRANVLAHVKTIIKTVWILRCSAWCINPRIKPPENGHRVGDVSSGRRVDWFLRKTRRCSGPGFLQELHAIHHDEHARERQGRCKPQGTAEEVHRFVCGTLRGRLLQKEVNQQSRQWRFQTPGRNRRLRFGSWRGITENVPQAVFPQVGSVLSDNIAKISGDRSGAILTYKFDLQVKFQSLTKRQGFIPQATRWKWCFGFAQQDQTRENCGGVPERGYRKLFNPWESGSAGRTSKVGTVPTGARESSRWLYVGVLLATQKHEGKIFFGEGHMQKLEMIPLLILFYKGIDSEVGLKNMHCQLVRFIVKLYIIIFLSIESVLHM